MLKFWKNKKAEPSNTATLAMLGEEFQRVLGNENSWQWDERFDAVLLHVDNKQKAKIVKIIEKYFSDYWNVLLDEEIPSAVTDLVRHLYGLRPEQLLFSTDTNKESFIYCAWWPWQDGQTISIRIALYGGQLSESESEAVKEEIRRCFLVENEIVVDS